MVIPIDELFLEESDQKGLDLQPNNCPDLAITVDQRNPNMKSHFGYLAWQVTAKTPPQIPKTNPHKYISELSFLGAHVLSGLGT